MSELCNSKPIHFSNLIISDIILYLSYFIFFSPYLFKLFSYLSPLLVTTLLLLLAYSSVVERFRGCPDEEFVDCCLDDCGVFYEVVFGSSSMIDEVGDNEMESEDDDRSSGGGENVVEENRVCSGEIGAENRVTVGKLENNNDYSEIGEDNRVTVGEFVNKNCGEIGVENRATVGKLKNNNNCGEIGVENRATVGKLKNHNNCGEIGVENRATVGKLKNHSNCGEIGEENRVTVGEMVNNNCGEMVEERRMENFLKILDEFEKMSSNVKQINKKVAPLSGAKIDKVVEKSVKNGSEAKGEKIKFINGEKESNPMAKSQSQRVGSEANYSHGNSRDFDCNFSSYGSMRKDKEWKRTLACKLFEERHTVDGGEGMDSLWEAYEIDSDKSKTEHVDMNKNKKMKMKNMKKMKSEVEDEDDEIVGQLCCLQALNLSAGKMNMGIGRPNLVKNITKAIKGIGWLHHVSKKKVHNHGDKDRYY